MTEPMETVLVLAGRRASGALLTLARRVGVPEAVVFGSSDPAAPGFFGARTVHLVSDLDGDPVTARVEALVRLAQRVRPIGILLASDEAEIAARVAVRLESGVLTGVVDAWIGPEGLIALQETGSHLVESCVVRGVAVCTVRTDAVAAVPDPVGAVLRHEEFACRPRVSLSAARPRTSLCQAAVVVTGGRGVGSDAGFELVEQVARALGGVAAGTNAAATQGWCSGDKRVDLTGKAVHPQLYLGLGVSGSARHRAGMRHAKTVVAIDRDPRAPIFEFADFGVVGDLHEVARELLAEIQRRATHISEV